MKTEPKCELENTSNSAVMESRRRLKYSTFESTTNGKCMNVFCKYILRVKTTLQDLQNLMMFKEWVGLHLRR